MPLKFDKLWSCRDARTQVDWMKLLFDLYIWPLWFLCSNFKLPLCPNQEPAKAATHKVFRDGSPKDWGEPGPTVGWCLNSLSFSNAILHIIGFLWSSPLKASMRSFIIKMGWLEREEKIGNLCKYQDRYLNQAKLFSSYEFNTCILDFTSKENGFEPPEMPPASPASKLGLDHPLFGVLVKKKRGRFLKADFCQKSECIGKCCAENCNSAKTSEVCQIVGLIIQIFHSTSQISLTLSAALSDDQCCHS